MTTPVFIKRFRESDVHLTIIHPCVGRRPGERYIGTWQMEPLPAATLAGLPVKDVAVAFYDKLDNRVPYVEIAAL